MEKNFYSANGALYTLFSEKTGMFYSRKYNIPTKPNATMTERGISWLGSVRIYRFKGMFRNVEFSLSFIWLIVLFMLLWKLFKWAVVMLFTAIGWIFVQLWRGLKWLGIHLWKALRWLSLLLAAVFAWLIAKFRRPKAEKETIEQPKEKKPMSWKWLRWALPLAALFLIVWFWPNPKSIEPVLTSTNKVVSVMPRQTAIARAYLDQEANLLGCKFIFNKKAQEYLKGKENNLSTFESVSDASWVADVDNLLNPEVKAKLSDDQIAVITLVAMRNGRFGFEQSDFLKFVNQGEYQKAVDAIWLHNADGSKMKLQDEALRYTWCLWALGKGYVTFNELWEAPSWAYQNLNVKNLYFNRERIFKPEFKEIMLGKGCSNALVKDFKFFEGRDICSEEAVDVYTFPEDSWWNKICRFMHPAKKALRGLFGVKA